MAGEGRFWPSRAQIRRHHRLMRRMIRTAGLKPQDVAKEDGGLVILEVRAKCSYCEHERACEAWLEEGKGLRQPPDFCANARTFRALQEALAPPASRAVN